MLRPFNQAKGRENLTLEAETGTVVDRANQRVLVATPVGPPREG